MTRIALILALLSSAALAQSTAPPTISLDSLPGNGPALLLFDADASGKDFQSQWNTLAKSAANLRQLTVIPILNETSVPLPPSNGLKVALLNSVDQAQARQTFHCAGTSFCVVFLAKDGTPRPTSGPVSTTNLAQLINPPPTQLDRAIAQGQASVYKTLISGPTANPFTLADLLDAGRPLLVFAQSADDPAFRAQWKILADHAADLIGRSVIVIPIFAIGSPALPPAHGLPVKALDELNRAKARNDFACNSAAFCVVLLDMSDHTLLQASSPASINQIVAAIASSPSPASSGGRPASSP